MHDARMKPASLPSAVEDALARYRKGYGVIHYFAFEGDGTHGDALHRAVTLAAFALLREKPEVSRLRLTMVESLMRSSPVAVTDFVGSLSTSGGVVTSPGEFSRARRRAFDEKNGFSVEHEDSYLRAFCHPPYPLDMSADAAQWSYDTINDYLFGGFRDDLEIRRWSDDWSSFFDAGKEWWGALWWSIHNRTRNLAIVVAASATD